MSTCVSPFVMNYSPKLNSGTRYNDSTIFLHQNLNTLHPTQFHQQPSPLHWDTFMIHLFKTKEISGKMRGKIGGKYWSGNLLKCMEMNPGGHCKSGVKTHGISVHSKISRLRVNHLILYLVGRNEPRNSEHPLSLPFSLSSSFFCIEILVVLQNGTNKYLPIKPISFKSNFYLVPTHKQMFQCSLIWSLDLFRSYSLGILFFKGIQFVCFSLNHMQL